MSLLRSLWKKEPRYRGLQIMTIGFIGAVLGACLSLAGDFLKDEVVVSGLGRYVSMLFVYAGWSLLLLGALIMSIGILLHWMHIFRSR